MLHAWPANIEGIIAGGKSNTMISQTITTDDEIKVLQTRKFCLNN